MKPRHPSSWLGFALLVLSATSCGKQDLFTKEIPFPDLPPEERYSVEAVILSGDTSTVFITQATAENEPLDPGFVQGAVVAVSIGGAPAEAFEEVERGEVEVFGVPGRVTFYRKVFEENELPVGASVELNIDLPDGTQLRATASVPRSAVSFSPQLVLNQGFSEANLTATVGDAPGVDRYLIRGSVRAFDIYGSRPTENGEVWYYQNAGLSERSYGSRLLLSDERFGGGSGSEQVTAYLTEASDSMQVTLRLYGINPEGYDYLEASQRAADQADNLLVEPIIIPSNVEGGLGGLIVAGQALTDSVTLVRR